MATSNEKVAALRDRLPELIATIAGGDDMGSVSLMGIPIPLTDIAGMVAPLIAGEVDRLAAAPTDDLDATLDRVIEFVAELRSDQGDA